MMIHLNDNILCVITAFCTGPDIYKDDIIQLCVVPVDHNLDVCADIPIFTSNIMQINFGADKSFLGQNINKVEEIAALGAPLDTVLEQFDIWYEGLKLKFGKKIMPLSYDYPIIRDFLLHHMEPEMYYQYFSRDYRDILPAALFLNDRSWFHGVDFVFNKVKLSYIGSTLKIPALSAFDIFAKADAILKIYKTMMNVYVS